MSVNRPLALAGVFVFGGNRPPYAGSIVLKTAEGDSLQSAPFSIESRGVAPSRVLFSKPVQVNNYRDPSRCV